MTLDADAAIPADGFTAWAQGYSLNGERNDDDDKDGETNIQEFYFGGNPTNAADRAHMPRMKMVTQGDTNALHYAYRLRSPLSPGETCRTEQTESLINPVWIPITPAVTGQRSLPEDNSHLSITNKISLTNSNSFIRLMIEEQ